MFLSKHYKKNNFKIIASLACLIFIFTATKTVSQSQLPNPIILGIRPGVPQIGSVDIGADGREQFRGFCKVFGDELENYLRNHLLNQNEGFKIKYTKISNYNRGPNYPRYDGLKTGKIHIQCGPNSKTSSDNEILFSKTFFSTGIKLLLKKDLSQELTALSNDDLNNRYKSLRIGIIKNTTTYTQIFFRRSKFSKFQPYNTRNEALDALNNGNIDAFASDAIILRTLLEQGERDNPPYKEKGYDLFYVNPDKYITDLPEEYGIAVYNNPSYSPILINNINEVLDFETLKSQSDKLKNYENGLNIPTVPSDSGKARSNDDRKGPVLNLNFGFGVMFGMLAVAALIVLFSPEGRRKLVEKIAEVFGYLFQKVIDFFIK